MIDKTRASHIINRVIGLDLATTSGQGTDLLENFEGRCRDDMATFQACAGALESALAAHLGKQGEINVI